MERKSQGGAETAPDVPLEQPTKVGLQPRTNPQEAQQEQAIIGCTLLGCRIESVLGRGAAATVFLARHLQLDQLRALKVLRPNVANDPEMLQRFRSEAQNVARIKHENLVTLHNFGEEGGYFAFVMEYVEGQTLAQRVRASGPLEATEAAGVLLQACAGLEAAHREHITHRDIKPENLLLTEQGRVKVADFGVSFSQSGQRLTREGQSVGTPLYMSPEQCLSKPTDHRSDIYSLGLVGYFLLTGIEPMLGPTPMATMMNQVNQHPEPPRVLRPAVGPALSAVICRMIEKDPEQRQPSIAIVMDQLWAAFETPLQDVSPPPLKRASSTRVLTSQRDVRPLPPQPGPSRSRRTAQIVLGCGYLAAVLFGAWLWQREPSDPKQAQSQTEDVEGDLKQQYSAALLRDDKQAAFKLLTAYIALHPNDWALRRQRIALALELKQIDAALSELQALDRVSKLTEQETYKLILLHLQRQQRGLATALLARFCERSPARGPGLTLKLAKQLEQQAQPDLAILLVDHALRGGAHDELRVASLQLRLASGRAVDAAIVLLSIPRWSLTEIAFLPVLEKKLRTQLASLEQVSAEQSKVVHQLAERDRRFFFWFALADWFAADTRRVGELGADLLEATLVEVIRGGQWDDVGRAACKALRAKDPQGAQRLAKESLEQGVGAYNKDRFSEAVLQLSVHLALRPENARGWSIRGRAYVALHKDEQALADLTEAIRLEPCSPSAAHARALILRDRKQYAQAIRDFTDSIRSAGLTKDESHQIRVNRGFAYLLAGQPKKSLEDFQVATKKCVYPVCTLGLALARDANGQAGAQASLARVLPTGKGASLSVYLGGRAHLEVATRVIALLPRHPLAHSERGNVQRRLGNRGEAIRDLEKALALCTGKQAKYRAAIQRALAAARGLPQKSKR